MAKFVYEIESKFEKSQNPILLVLESCNGFPFLDCGRTAILMNGKVIKGTKGKEEKQWHDKVIGELPSWFIIKLQCKLHQLKRDDLKWTNNAEALDGPFFGFSAQNSEGDMIPLFKNARSNSGRLEQYKFIDDLMSIIELLDLLKLDEVV